MNRDARVTLYGGAAISVVLVVLGVATNSVLGITGVGFAGATLAISLLFDRVSTA